MLLREILKYLAWAGLLFGVWIVLHPLRRLLREPTLHGIAVVLEASTFVLLPAAVLVFVYSYPNPFGDSLLEQWPGMWLFGVALAAYVLGDWLEGRADRVE